MFRQYGWNKSKKFDVDNAGGLNQRRPLSISRRPSLHAKLVTPILVQL